jgi:hypothetical protein
MSILPKDLLCSEKDVSLTSTSALVLCICFAQIFAFSTVSGVLHVGGCPVGKLSANIAASQWWALKVDGNEKLGGSGRRQ